MQAHALKPAVPAQRPRSPWQLLPRGVRAKLKLGGAHDEAEKQADRIAHQALDKKAAGQAADPVDQRAALRRALAPASERQAPAADEEQLLPENLEREITALQSGGQPLPPPVRGDMEGRFGMDLSTVRIHTGPDATRLNEALHAHAFAVGEHIAFNEGRYQPESGPGRFLLAHELAHVAQQRGATQAVEKQPVRRGFWGDLYDSAVETLGDIAEWAADKVSEFGWSLLESIAPDFARTVRAIVDEGILTWLGRQVARAWDGYIATLRALVPFEGPQQLIDLFAGLVERAARIAAALVSGDCGPLMEAIGEMKTFVVETVGVAWDKLVDFLRPVGEFFTGLWNDFGAPAVQWLQNFGGEVWTGIQQLGRDFWEWIRPVREAASRVWDWFKETLFGPSTGEDTAGSSGGVLGWITTKAGEAWDWVKERTRPVWQPVAEFASAVAELIPPAFIRDMGQHAQQLSGQLDAAAGDMGGGEGVPESRDTLASVLPSVQQIILTVRSIIVGAGQWLMDKITGVATQVSSLVTGIRNSEWLSWLAGAFSWLEEAVVSLTTWARDKVAVLFNWLVQGFDALTPFLQLVLETVQKVIGIFGDLLQLPLLILNSIWQRVPECIRVPVEDFIKNQILARIPVFGQFFSDATLWPRVQATALDILRRVFVDGDLPGAAWAFFQAILSIFGVPAQLVVQILAKAAGALGDILTNPIGFLLNLLRAVGAGFTGFFSRIGTHLLNGFSNWLFGTVREAGINPPADLSLRSILGFVMEVLGVTVDNIFTRLKRKLDPAIVDRLRGALNLATGAWSFIATLVTEGPAGLWRELSEQLSSLWDSVIEGVTGYITEKVIGWASRWLASLLDVTGIMPVINTLIAIYNAIESFMEYLRQILEMVNRVLDGIVGIARGEIEQGAGFVENAMADGLPIAIGFLANQAGLGKLSARLREILGGLRARVDAAIDWLLDKAIRLGQAVIDLVRRGAAAVRTAASRLGAWASQLLGLDKRFETRTGEPHRLYFEERGDNVVLMMASTVDTYENHISRINVTAGTPAATQKQQAVTCAREIDALIASRKRTATTTTAATATTPANTVTDQSTAFTAKLAELSTLTANLLSQETGGPLPVTPLPTYGGLHDGFAKRMHVKPLTRLGVPGTAVQVNSTVYENLLKRTETPGGRAYYIAGHLLNNNVHGSGTTWQNLTPIAQGTNQEHESEVETHVKDAVEAGGILEYTVEVDYQRNLDNNRRLIAEILTHADGSGNLPADLEIKKTVLDAEQKLPSALFCSLEKFNIKDTTTTPVTYEADSTFGHTLNRKEVPNTIQDDDIEKYYVRGVAYSPASEYTILDTAAKQALAQTPPLSWNQFINAENGRKSRIKRLRKHDASKADALELLFGRSAATPATPATAPAATTTTAATPGNTASSPATTSATPPSP